MFKRRTARDLAAESLAAAQPLAWFEQLYTLANGDASLIPWADMTVNPNLQSWLAARQPNGSDKQALVIGCGLGDDAEALSALGFTVTAFDIAESWTAWCRQRFPESSVTYQTADFCRPLRIGVDPSTLSSRRIPCKFYRPICACKRQT